MPERVLLVDDEVRFADILAERLGARGFTVRVAHDAEEALSAASGEDVDVAVLDVHLPGRSGLDILRELKSERPHVEAIMLTGATELATAVTGMKLGAADYLTKPVDIDVLVAAIRRAAGRKAGNLANLRMIETGKLAMIGALAEGVAHEINNPVNIMFHEAGWMEDLIEDAGIADGTIEAEMHKSLRTIQSQGRRCRAVIGKLLSLGGRIDPRPRTVAPDRLAAPPLRAARKRARQLGVEVAADFAPDLPELRLPPAHIEQVLTQLFDNALEAMEETGGELRLTVRREGENVVFIVSDTGRGIAESILPRVFDPFFSTKEVGKGTGLGLSICRGILVPMGGDARIESEPGRGTVVTVTLPIEPAGAPGQPDSSGQPGQSDAPDSSASPAGPPRPAGPPTPAGSGF